MHITARYFFTAVLFFLPGKIYSQTPKHNGALLSSLKEVSNCHCISKHFARLYYRVIEITTVYSETEPEAVKRFTDTLDAAFTALFFEAHNNYKNQKSQSFPWQRYYADTTLNELQYQFMGMNAHINGDLLMALKNKFCYDTLKKYRPYLLQYQKVLNPFFDSIYKSTYQYREAQQLHTLSMTLDKNYGRKMIYKWRKRQVTLALLWYKNPAAFQRRWKQLQHKMVKLDRFAIRRLK
jgi:Family of unknown function (DUF5995)